MSGAGKEEVATFGGGCFWCTEAVFDRIQGVKKVEPGYCGGHTENPTYQQVCTGTTGHAEVIQITFDPLQVSYAQLLEVFFRTHDPTTLNQQGADRGTQYRSVIFYHSDEQRQFAEQAIERLTSEQVYARPIVTEITPAATFFVAESYHHDYFAANPGQSYCAMVVAPKVEKFKRAFAGLLKPNTQ